MAIAGWRSDSTLKSLVFEHYGRFNVFQLMRLLLWKRRRDGVKADRAPMPAAVHIDRRLRFTADLSAAFPGSEVSRLSARGDAAIQPDTEHAEHATGDGVIDISTPNFCIAGTLGPLPEPFTEWVRDLKRMREPAMEDFFNIFNQRMNVLRFQLKSRQTLALNNAPPAETPHARYLAALMGMAHKDLAAQVPLPRRAWLGLAGLLANARRSAFTVSHVASEFLGAGTELEQLVGAWQLIEPDNRMSLGLGNHRLGQQSVLGRRVWDQQARVRLTVAPLPYDDFCRLLPPNDEERRTQVNTQLDTQTDDAAPPAYGSFTALLRLLLDRQCDCEVRLEVDAATVPPRLLSAGFASRQDRRSGLRLGQTAWLASSDHMPHAARYQAGYLVRAYDTAEAA